MSILDVIAAGPKPPEVQPLGEAIQEQRAKNLTMRSMLQKQQMGDLELQQTRQAIADDQAGRALFAQGEPTDADIYRTYGAKGSAIIKARMDAREAQAKLKETNGKNAANEADFAGSLGAMVKAADYSPAAFELALQHAANADPSYAEHLRPLADMVKRDPSQIKAITDQLIAASPGQRKLQTEAETAASHTAQAASTAKKVDAELPGIQAEAQLKQRQLEMIQNADPVKYIALVDQIVPPGVPENAALNSRTKALVQFALQNGDVAGAKAALTSASAETRQLEIATDPRIAKQKISINLAEAAGRASASNAAANNGPLTEDDYKRAGAEYAITGTMPSLGNGGAAVKSKILHYKMEFARQNNLNAREMALAKASFNGDEKSLVNFQKQRDQIVSFENTAQKNIDTFLNLASKIRDTGVPWVNTPMRLLDEKLVGSENMAAINAARQVANNEIAKVTSGGGLSGVLSDSARHEVESYNPRDATLAQTKAIVKVLKSDMANRRASMDSMLSEIKGRVGSVAGGSPAPDAGAAKATHRYNPTTGKIEEIK